MAPLNPPPRSLPRRSPYFAVSVLFHLLLLLVLSRAVFFTTLIPPPVTEVRLVALPELPEAIALPSRPDPQRSPGHPRPAPPPGAGPASAGSVEGASPARSDELVSPAAPEPSPRVYPGLKEYLRPPGLDVRIRLREAPPAEVEPYKAISVNPAALARSRRLGYDIGPWAEAAVDSLTRSWLVSPDLPLPSSSETGIAIAWDRNGIPLPSVTWTSGSAILDRCALNAVIMSAGDLRRPADWPERHDLYVIFHFRRPDADRADTLPVQTTPAGPENDPCIARLGLLDPESLFSSPPPERLAIGVEMKRGAPYRLTRDRRPVDEGVFHDGFNRLTVPTAGLFGDDPRREYRLEILDGDRVHTRLIRVRAGQIESANSGQVPDELRRAGFGVALFMENQLLAWQSRPLSFPRLSVSQRDRLQRALERRAGAPPDPLNREERALQRASLPVLALPMLAWKALRSAREKKREQTARENAPLPLYREFRAVLLIQTPNGLPRPVEVTLTVD